MSVKDERKNAAVQTQEIDREVFPRQRLYTGRRTRVQPGGVYRVAKTPKDLCLFAL